MAEKLIDSLAGDFDPGKYHDEYREQLLSMIERKGSTLNPARDKCLRSTERATRSLER